MSFGSALSTVEEFVAANQVRVCLEVLCNPLARVTNRLHTFAMKGALYFVTRQDNYLGFL
jgi:hypothetical protein